MKSLFDDVGHLSVRLVVEVLASDKIKWPITDGLRLLNFHLFNISVELTL